jgi:hypothetical protein
MDHFLDFFTPMENFINSIFQNKKVWNPKPLKSNFTAFGPNDDFEIRIQARDNKGYTVNMKKPDVSCQPESPISPECANGFYGKEQILLSYIVVINREKGDGI